jgi:hypothetical protein
MESNSLAQYLAQNKYSINVTYHVSAYDGGSSWAYKTKLKIRFSWKVQIAKGLGGRVCAEHA